MIRSFFEWLAIVQRRLTLDKTLYQFFVLRCNSPDTFFLLVQGGHFLVLDRSFALLRGFFLKFGQIERGLDVAQRLQMLL